MRLLYMSNFTSQSGYSGQAHLFVPALIAAGHEVTVINIAAGNQVAEIEGVKVLPLGNDPLGNDIIQSHVERTRAQAVITLVDVWAFNPDIWNTFSWFPHTPVDHMPCPPAVVNALSAATKPIAMSRYGQAQLKGVGLDSYYVPLAYNPAVWVEGDKKSARAKLGIPDDLYYVTFIGVNDSCPSRKGIPELLAAWSAYSKQNPKARLRLHTSLTGRLHQGPTQGVNITVLMKTFGIDPATVSIVDQYRYMTGFPQSELVTLAQASDLFILPSHGEGFGLPLVEFQAVGCPVATTAFTSGVELNFSGWMIDGEPDWSWQNSMQMKPGIASIAEALDAGYQERNNSQRRQSAIEQAKEYAIANVTSKYLMPVVDEMSGVVIEMAAHKIVQRENARLKIEKEVA